MAKLTEFLMRRRWLVLGVWVGVLLLAAPFAAKQTSHLTGGGFIDGGSASAQVERELSSFPGNSAATLAVVLDPQPDATRAEVLKAVRIVRTQVAEIDSVRLGERSFATAAASGAADPERPVLIPFGVAGGESAAIDVAKELRFDFGITETGGGEAGSPRVSVYLGGQGALWAAIQATTKSDVETAEIRAFPLIALVLLAVFGSLAAAVLPLSLGAASVLLSGAFIYFLSLEAQTSVVVTTVASMLGLGIAVDYSLFILVRYREEMAAGAGVEEAIAAALSTSGVAVLISGVTVMASLAALFLIDSTAMKSIAAGAMFVVAVSVLVAATLLPILIRLLGRRVSAPGRIGRLFRRGGEGRAEPFWLRWSAAVMRRPVVSVLGAVAILVILALPAFSMRIENTGLRQVDQGDSFRLGLAAAVEVAGPGGLGPVQVVVSSAAGPVGPAAVARARRVVVSDPGVRIAAAPQFSPDRSRALIVATLRSDPTSDAARSTVRRLRGSLRATEAAGAEALVGGTTASVVDFDDLIDASLWKLTLVVLALSYLVLVPLLRSVVLPLKAVLMTMFSVAAGFGITVAIFQWGWLSFLGLDQAPAIDTTTPPLVIVIAFGLSMDYEVFMLSRIRERFLATGDTRRAVTEGLSGTAKTITSAALIMVIVFLAFVTAGLPSVQRLGVAAAATIAIDATLVRLVLVPGLMVLLGRWNWWMPRPLARLLPELKLESR